MLGEGLFIRSRCLDQLLRIFVVFLLIQDFAASAYSDSTNIVNRPFTGLLNDIHEWRRGFLDEEIVRKEMLSFGTNGFPVLIKCLSRLGFPAGNTAEARGKATQNRDSAVVAVWLMGQQAKPILPDLVELAKERNWKGREMLVRSISAIGAPNSTVVELGLQDIASSKRETRFEGVLILIGQTAPGARDALISATTDVDSTIRDNAIYGLKPLTRDPVVKRHLEQLASNKKYPIEVRFRAETVLHSELINRESSKAGVR
jgi:hypothetical protein